MVTTARSRPRRTRDARHDPRLTDEHNALLRRLASIRAKMAKHPTLAERLALADDYRRTRETLLARYGKGEAA